ncbi:hypothetical protein EMCRGX_G013770 [Ephydatia muelleri]
MPMMALRLHFIISDPPHLMKTVRNCWANPKQRLGYNGMEVSWKPPNEMYIKNRTQADDTGLALIPKLKHEHLHLTSYSKALSNSVGKALMLTVGTKATQTAHFAEMFDKFFDCLNGSRRND